MGAVGAEGGQGVTEAGGSKDLPVYRYAPWATVWFHPLEDDVVPFLSRSRPRRDREADDVVVVERDHELMS